MVKAGGDRTVTWAANGGTIKKATGFPITVTVDSTTTLVVEFYTYDNGVTVFAQIHWSIQLIFYVSHWAKTTKTFQELENNPRVAYPNI